jgi:hypothetical protein
MRTGEKVFVKGLLKGHMYKCWPISAFALSFPRERRKPINVLLDSSETFQCRTRTPDAGSVASLQMGTCCVVHYEHLPLSSLFQCCPSQHLLRCKSLSDK